MRRTYPYLQNSYKTNSNEEVVRREFLKKIDGFANQKKYFKVTLLNWNEEPLKEIGGDLTTGSITKDGSSSVRRTCQFSATVDTASYDVSNMTGDFAINKKIYLEIGIKNYTAEYPEYPILWFPQGVFVISSFSASTSTSSALNINISLKDKMSMLNGECGGTFPATTILDTQDTQNDKGEAYTEKVLVYNIIQEVVNHFGNEPLENIVIEDVPSRIRRIVRWNGDTSLNIYKTVDENGQINYIPTTDTMKTSDKLSLYRVANQGDDIGYVYDDFVYDSELTVNAGETVTSALDKIKSWLGNYEYFYDEAGVFHFREIKNYLNTTQGKVLTTEMNLNDYLVDSTVPKDVYTFSDDANLLSVSANPQYSNIKNDFIVQGLRKMTTANTSYPVRYHVAIDKKPEIGNTYTRVLIYEELGTGTQKAIFPIEVETLPDFGEFNSVYKTADKAYVWDDNSWKEIKIVKWYDGSSADTKYITKDWRTELYMRGLQALKNGTDQGYYFAELQDAWPQIYDLEKQQFFGEAEDSSIKARVLTEGNYFLDFIDSTSALGDYSVNAIGRRSDVVVNEDINCLFEPDIPNIVFLNIDDQDTIGQDEWEKYKEECIKAGQPYAQVRGDIYNAMQTGGYHNGAYAQICFEIVSHTIYQTSVSITALPVYYLEPNSRIKLNDTTTQTFGDYMVQSLSIPLDAGSTMSGSLTQCLQKM